MRHKDANIAIESAYVKKKANAARKGAFHLDSTHEVNSSSHTLLNTKKTNREAEQVAVRFAKGQSHLSSHGRGNSHTKGEVTHCRLMSRSIWVRSPSVISDF